MIPFVPAGTTKVVRAGKKAEKVIENIGKASKQDKVAGMKVLEDVAKKN